MSDTDKSLTPNSSLRSPMTFPAGTLSWNGLA